MIKFGQKLDVSGDYYISSDFHFGHKNILKFCPKTRPWETVEDMEEGLISEWNSKVSEEGIVFHLGDMFFCKKDKIEDILSRLNGHVVHLYGNHSKILRTEFTGLNAFDYLEVKYDKHHIVMNHYAQRVWNRSHYGSLMFYGHSHGGLPGIGRSMDVGYDAHGKILTLQEAVDMVKYNEILKEDHH